jgi:hypothetical protein
MRVSTSLALLFAAALGCYGDIAAPAAGLTTVLLKHEYPVDFVDRIEVYVTEIAASTESDDVATTAWSVIARPRKTVALELSANGTPVLLGDGLLGVGAYGVIRVSIQGDSSRVWLRDGRLAKVRWPSGGQFGVYARADDPIVVGSGGTDIVVALDGTQSFNTLLADPLHDLVFTPVARATPAEIGGSGSHRARTTRMYASPLPLDVVPLEAP